MTGAAAVSTGALAVALAVGEVGQRCAVSGPLLDADEAEVCGRPVTPSARAAGDPRMRRGNRPEHEQPGHQGNQGRAVRSG